MTKREHLGVIGKRYPARKATLPKNPSTMDIRDWVENQGGKNAVVSRMSATSIRVDVAGLSNERMERMQKDLQSETGFVVLVQERTEA